MRNVFTQATWIVVFILFAGYCLGQSEMMSDLSLTLTASKNGKEHIYKPGIHVLIKYQSDSTEKKVRGYFTGIRDERFAVITKRNKTEPILVPVESIVLVRKIRPSQRIYFAAAGIALVTTGAVIIDKLSDSPGSAMAGAIMIPVIGAGVYFLWAIPISHFLERINEKSKKNGWVFSFRKIK